MLVVRSGLLSSQFLLALALPGPCPRRGHRLLLFLRLLARSDEPQDAHHRVYYERQHARARPLPHGDADAAQRRPREGHEPLDVVGEPSVRQPEHGLLAVPHWQGPLYAARRDEAGRRQVAVEFRAGGVDSGFCGPVISRLSVSLAG